MFFYRGILMILVATACGGHVVGDGPDVGTPTHDTSGVATIAAGFTHTCSVMNDHRLWCWGTNDDGELGDGTMSGQVSCDDGLVPCDPSPIALGLGDATSVVANYRYTCALKSDGTVWCWGSNVFAQIGDGTITGEPCSAGPCKPTPTRVGLLHDVTSLTAGFGHACALESNGSVWCWGEDGSGQVGDAMTNAVACFQNVPCVPSPFEITSVGSDVKAVAAGGFETCVIANDDSLWCWGSNEFGELGNSNPLPSLSPIQVAIGTVTAVSVGGDHACAQKSDGTLWCWGRNDGGEVGDGTTSGDPCGGANFSVCRTSPVQVTALGVDVHSIAVGNWGTCAIENDGSLWCWGQNVGDGSTAARSSPIKVAGFPTTISHVALGDMHTCVTATDSSLWCWGQGGYGELGVGGLTSALSPIHVADF